MENNTFYHEILIDHNQHPVHKHKLEDANLVLEGVNPSCGDDIILQLKVEDGKITDGAYIGDGCAISQASAEEIEELEEGSALQDISHMPARVKCAVLGWHTMEELLDK